MHIRKKNSSIGLWFLCLLAVLGSDCQTGNKVCTPETVENWFINPENSKTLELSKLPINTIDSLINIIHKGHAAGAVADTLTDSSGSQYVLGYCTPHTFRYDTLYPLLIYLHGGTGTSLSNKGEKAYDMFLPLIDSMNIFLASPSADRNSRWWSAEGLDRILQTLRYMSLYYPIDPDRVFLAGVSDGATGCWTAINSINGPFAGFFAISGFGGMLSSMGCELYPQNIAQRPIYNVNAGLDELYPIDIVNNFLDYMHSQGIQLERMSYPDEKHGFDYREKEYGSVCRFIRTWKRTSQRSINWTFVSGKQNRPPSVIDWQYNDAANIRTIQALRSNDTLSISALGVQKVAVELPDAPENLFIKTENGKIKKTRSDKSSYLLLKSRIMRADPFGNNSRIFQISF